MGKKQREKNAPVLVICVMILVFIVGLCGIYLFSQIGGTQPSSSIQNKISETGSTEDETEETVDAGEMYSEDIAEENIAFDEESGLQYADNQLLITTVSGVTEQEVQKLIDPYQASIVGRIEMMNIYQIKFPQSYTKEELDQIKEALSSSNKIENCGENHVMDVDINATYPNDAKWKGKWKKKNPTGITWGMEAIHAPEAWDYYNEMQGVNVGVYDNMFYNHEDLKFHGILNNVANLNNSHGTHVSGTIGANYNNKLGVCGVFPKARLYAASFETLENQNQGEMGRKVAFYDLICANRCRVVNLSIGTNVVTYAAARGNQAAKIAVQSSAKIMGDFLEELLKLNDFVICKAAGNGNSTESYVRADANDADAPYGYIPYDNDHKGKYAKYENQSDFNNRISNAQKDGSVEAYDGITAITNAEVRKRILVVGAAENLGKGKYKMADFSDCGNRVDVAAPGVDIYSTVESTGYEDGWSGTSMATPHVTGLAAMCFSVNKNLTGAQVVDIICKTAEGSLEYTTNNGSKKFKYPLINAQKAVERARSTSTAKNKTKKTAQTNESDKNTKQNVSRDVVMVLDNSGSMAGEPLEQTKDAAYKFLDTVFGQDSRVALVTYSESADVCTSLTKKEKDLTDQVDEMGAFGGTNMYSGMEEADRLLSNSTADRKIIVLMSDGCPNQGENDNGDYFSPLIRYAEELKNKGYYVYTLGFFSAIYGSERTDAQHLMEQMASPGLHYEVTDADSLVFFFDDIANQISGRAYVYVRIACPVDVTVTSGGETLSSREDSENTRTSFGTLTYEAVKTDEQEDTGGISYYDDEKQDDSGRVDNVKILRLDMESDYDISIEGYAGGEMTYTVKFPNEQGEYDDTREFPDIPVSASMQAVSSTSLSDATYLDVDEDGDGKIDTTYKATSNGSMEIVKDNTLLYIVIAAMVVIVILIITLIVVLVKLSSKKKPSYEAPSEHTPCAGYIYGAFGVYQGQMYPMYLGQECVVGRKTGSDIQIVHGEISRVHCVIKMLPDGVYQVTDYSSNGTYYNNKRLKYGDPYRLPKGALLALGDADNVLELK